MNETESVLVRWMNLEPVTEWNRSEKEKQISYQCIYMKSREMGRAGIETQM